MEAGAVGTSGEGALSRPCRVAGFESHIRSWRRAPANGFKPLHESLSTEINRSIEIWVWEEAVIAGLVQTPEYARHVIRRYSELPGPANDVEDAVPANGFWVLDDRLVVAEDWHAELWWDDTENIALHEGWQTLRESAVYGADAVNIINAARRTLNLRGMSDLQ